MNPSPPATFVTGFSSETIEINGIRLHYWLGGNLEGQPVLLWHGFLSTGLEWRNVMPLLIQAGYVVLVPEMRGYGDSDKPAGVDGYDARSLAEVATLLSLAGVAFAWKHFPNPTRNRKVTS